MLLLHDFKLKVGLLLTFFVKFLSGFIKQSFVEILTLFLILFTKLSPQFNLLVKHIFDLLTLDLGSDLLLLLLFFIESLAEFLDLAPLVVADIAWQVFNLSLYSITVLDGTFLLLICKLSRTVSRDSSRALILQVSSQAADVGHQ